MRDFRVSMVNISHAPIIALLLRVVEVRHCSVQSLPLGCSRIFRTVLVECRAEKVRTCTFAHAFLEKCENSLFLLFSLLAVLVVFFLFLSDTLWIPSCRVALAFFLVPIQSVIDSV